MNFYLKAYIVLPDLTKIVIVIEGKSTVKILFGERIRKKNTWEDKWKSIQQKPFMCMYIHVSSMYGLGFVFVRGFCSLKACCSVAWISKARLHSDRCWHICRPWHPSPRRQDCKWCYFSTKQWYAEGIRRMNFNWHDMNLKLRR